MPVAIAGLIRHAGTAFAVMAIHACGPEQNRDVSLDLNTDTESTTQGTHFMRCTYCVLLFTMLFFETAMAATPDAEGFVPMFNGQDLSGWVLTNTPSTLGPFRTTCWFVQGNRLANYAPSGCIRISSWNWNGGTWCREATRECSFGPMTSPPAECRFIVALKCKFWRMLTGTLRVIRRMAISSRFMEPR